MSAAFTRPLPRRALAVLSALALLAGCGSGGGPSVSGSASENSKTESGLSSLWEKARSLIVESGKTYEMPALGLMADAFLADYTARDLDFDLLAEAVLARHGDAIPRLDAVITSMIAPTRQQIVAQPPGTVAKLTPLDPDHMVYESPIIIAMQSRKGWEVQAMDDCRIDPAFDTPFFRRNRPPCRYDRETHIRYMELLAASAIYTNTIFSLIDKDLGASRLADPDAVRRQVLLTFQSIPVATLQAALRDAVGQVSTGQFSTDLTGSNNIHFTHSPAGDFVGDPRGLTWTKAGGVYFGDGRISGQTVNLRLASTVGRSQRQAQSGNTGAQTGAQVEGAGGVSAGKQ